ncbi:TPA: BACON domain-containing protein [Methanosarcinaceae archaeon]|nr:BACON domain-containing protein [Methanosarcinaceae archaeon]
MGDNQDHKEIKEPFEGLAKEITQKYTQELTREAFKRALKNKSKDLSEKEIKKLEIQLKKLTDAEKLTRFEKASEEISREILEGKLTSEQAIEEISTVLESSLETEVSFLARATPSLKNIPLPVKIALYILVPFLAVTALLIMPSLSISEGDMSFNLSEGESDFTQFQVSNAGGGILLWTASSDQPWIALSPERGGNDDTVVVIVDAGGMEEGTYEGSVTVKSPAGTEECPVYLSVEPSYKNQNSILELSPDPLSFNFDLMEGESGYEEFEISNGGEGILEWEVSADETWITLSPESGTNSETVTVTIDTEDLSSGEEYEGTITVESNGGDEEGRIYLNVSPEEEQTEEEQQPEEEKPEGEEEGTIDLNVTPEEELPEEQTEEEPTLAVDPDPLSLYFELLEGESGSDEFYISNEGGGDLEWEVRADEPWITLNQESGTNSETVSVIVDTYGLSPGEGYEGNITIESNGWTEEGIVYLNVLLGEEPILAVDPDPLYFSFELIEGESDSGEFYISNEGGGDLDWEVSTDEPWITLSPESGTNSETVTVTVDTEDLSPGEEYEGTITVESNGGDEEGIIYIVLSWEEPS